MNSIFIYVSNPGGFEKELEAPIDMGLNLMEFLKANEYDILATCGGIALCATCHVSVLRGFENLGEISDDEYAILDTLPGITETSRLSCQVKLNDAKLNGLTLKILGE